MQKTIEESFIDWEAHVFGFGYGTGEEYVLEALKYFFAEIGRDPERPGYDYQDLEKALGSAVAWLLINTLCHADIIEYGTSPRFGWLTAKGEALKAYVDAKAVSELIDLCCGRDQDYFPCSPDACNCGPRGYQEGVKCQNPFW